MRAMILLMITTILAMPLAGCVDSGDGPQFELSAEDIEGLIDANLDDFLNNSSITIINNNFNNTSNNVDQSGASSSNNAYFNGTSEELGMFVYRHEWTTNDVLPNLVPKKEDNFTTIYTYYDYATNNDRTDSFTLSCSNYYDVPEMGGNSNNNETTNSNETTSSNYWNDDTYYWYWWDNLYNNTIRDLLSDVASDQATRDACREDGQYRIRFYDNLAEAPIVFELNLPNGTALNVLQITTTQVHSSDGSYFSGNNNSRDVAVNGVKNAWNGEEFCPILNWNYGNGDEDCGNYYGGWDDLKLTFQYYGNVYTYSEFSFTIYYKLVPVSQAY